MRTRREIINRFWLANRSLFHPIEINMARKAISKSTIVFLDYDVVSVTLTFNLWNPWMRHVACFTKYRQKSKLFQSYTCTVVLMKWVVLKVTLKSAFVDSIGGFDSVIGHGFGWQFFDVNNFPRNTYEKSYYELLRRAGRIYHWHLLWENSRLCEKSISNFGRDEQTDFIMNCI